MSDRSDDTTLAISRCEGCGTIAVWPRHACVACGSIAFVESFASGRGQIHAMTVIHRPPTTDGGDASPYGVALISLDIGGQLMARVPIERRIGERVLANRATITTVPCVDPDPVRR